MFDPDTCKVYLIGGVEDSLWKTKVKKCQTFDLNSRTFGKIKKIPKSVEYPGSGMLAQKIYIFDGSRNEFV